MAESLGNQDLLVRNFVSSPSFLETYDILVKTYTPFKETVMNTINIQYYKTTIGELILGSYNNKLCLLDFRYRKMRNVVDNRLKSGLNADFIERDDDLLAKTRVQLSEYFLGERELFDLPLLTVGTEFQKQVWNALMEVPYGTTVAYIDLAKKIDNEKAVRAVANANGANAIGIIIPCHRIIGKNGTLVGYGGGLPAKKKLLNIESRDKGLLPGLL